LVGITRSGGVGGSFEADPYIIAQLRLGTIAFIDYTAFRVRSAPRNATMDDGRMSPDFFRIFPVLTRGRIYHAITARSKQP